MSTKRFVVIVTLAHGYDQIDFPIASFEDRVDASRLESKINERISAVKKKRMRVAKKKEAMKFINKLRQDDEDLEPIFAYIVQVDNNIEAELDQIFAVFESTK